MYFICGFNRRFIQIYSNYIVNIEVQLEKEHKD